MKDFHPVFKKVKDGGLGLTLHIAEVYDCALSCFVKDPDIVEYRSSQRMSSRTPTFY